jgi:hypothetical protein
MDAKAKDHWNGDTHRKKKTQTKSFRSSQCWLSLLIWKMWQIAWDLWEHRNGYLHNKEDNLISQEVNKRLEASSTREQKTSDNPHACYLPKVWKLYGRNHLKLDSSGFDGLL